MPFDPLLCWLAVVLSLVALSLSVIALGRSGDRLKREEER
jgi:hypothetical protein